MLRCDDSKLFDRLQKVFTRGRIRALLLERQKRDTVFKSFEGMDHRDMALFIRNGWRRSFPNCDFGYPAATEKSIDRERYEI